MLALTSRAVNLDPLDSRTHLCRSWSHAIAGSHSAALSHLDLALDLNENDPWTIISAALGFAFAGEIERARDLVGQARAFGMRHSRAAQGYIATAAYLIGDYAGVGRRRRRSPATRSSTCRPGRRRAASTSATARARRASMATFLDLALPRLDRRAEPERRRTCIDWFMGCFPIRDDEVRAELRRTLDAALQERRRLGSG